MRRYAICGGWFLESKHFAKVDEALCKVIRARGFPSAMICGHMPGAEKLSRQWAEAMLVREVQIIDLVMPVERAQMFHDHKPDILLSFTSGSPANDVLKTFLAARGVVVVEISV